MAKETQKTKGTPEIEQLSDSAKKEAVDVFMKIDGVTQDGASQPGGNSHSGYNQRAKVVETLGRGGPQGIYTNTVEHDPQKSAPRIDVADHKAEFAHGTTPALSDKYPEVKKAYEDKSQEGKDGIAAEKGQGQDQNKGNDGKENGRDI